MMPKNNEFFDQVYQVVRLVPKGRVTTYGAIGKFLGSAKSARMVGWAMNNSQPTILADLADPKNLQMAP